MSDQFDRLAQSITNASGSPWAFGLALLSVLVWWVVGLFVGFTDTHQLVINTGTTIVTFLMVFLIQAGQNRSDVAMQAKLDELVHAQDRAHNDLIDAEHQTGEAIAAKKYRVKEEDVPSS